MKLTHLILTIIFFLMLPQAQANNFVDITLHWLRIVGDGENINEPIFGDWVYPPEEAKYIVKLRSSYKFSKMSFSNFLRETEFIDNYWSIAINVKSDENNSMLLTQSGPVIDTKKLPKDMIVKVLNRRKPLLNNFAFDKSKLKVSTFDPKYFCQGNSQGEISYLDFVWQRLLIMMALSKDLRFEKEVNELMGYLMTPNKAISKWNEDDKIAHANLTCGGGAISHVKNICIGYLNIFRERQGKVKLNPGDRSTWIDFEWSKYISK